MVNKNFKIIFSHYGTLDGGDACGFTRSFNIAKNLVKIGHNVEFITTQKSGFKFPFYYEIRDGVKIFAFPEILPYSFRKGGFGFLSLFLKIIFVLFKSADIIHSDTGHRPSSGLPCIIHRIIYKSKYFSEWWEHFGVGGIYDDMPKWYQSTIGNFDRLFEVRNRKSANGCIPISYKLYNRSVFNGIDKKKLLILNGGSDIDKIKYLKNNSNKKEEFRLNKEIFTIGIIGMNNSEFINNINLISAVKNKIDSGFNIKIIATGNVSKMVMEEYNLYDSEFIQIYNWLPYDKFVNLVSCIDIFSLIQEDNLRNQSRFPNKLGDYFAAGRPIIANPVGEVERYINRYPKNFYTVNNSKEDVISQLDIAYDQWLNNKINYDELYNVANQNSWLERAKTLSNFYISLCNN